MPPKKQPQKSVVADASAQQREQPQPPPPPPSLGAAATSAGAGGDEHNGDDMAATAEAADAVHAQPQPLVRASVQPSDASAAAASAATAAVTVKSPVVPFVLNRDKPYFQYLTVYLLRLAYQLYASNVLPRADQVLRQEKLAIADKFVRDANDLDNKDLQGFLSALRQAHAAAVSTAREASDQHHAGIGQFSHFSTEVTEILELINAAFQAAPFAQWLNKTIAELDAHPLSQMIDRLYRLYLYPHQLFVSERSAFSQLVSKMFGDNREKFSHKAEVVLELVRHYLELRPFSDSAQAVSWWQKEISMVALAGLMEHNNRIEHNFSSRAQAALQALSSVAGAVSARLPSLSLSFWSDAEAKSEPAVAEAAVCLPSLQTVLEGLAAEMAPRSESTVALTAR